MQNERGDSASSPEASRTGPDEMPGGATSLRQTLATARAAGRRRSAWIQRPMLTLGVVLFAWPYILDAPSLVSLGSLTWLLAIRILSRQLSTIVFLAAVLPTQARIVRLTNFLYCVFAMFALYVLVRIWFVEDADKSDMNGTTCGRGSDPPPCWLSRANLAIGVVQCTGLALVCARALVALGQRRLTSRARLDLIWRMHGGSFLLIGLTTPISSVMSVLTGRWSAEQWPLHLWGICPAVVGVLALRAHLREHVQSWLAKRGEGASAAAVLAALFQERTVHKVVEDAARAFRCVPADTALELMCARPDTPASDALTSQFAASQPARFGGVDAFVCHSHHDNARNKWLALSAWRDEFKLKRDREPLLWIDSFCIDTTEDAEFELSFLPVFVAGCTQLVVLLGPSTLSRLWCLVEIFSFLQMGGDAEAVSVLLVADGDAAGAEYRHGNLASLSASQPAAHEHALNSPHAPRLGAPSTFSAREAECAFEEDRQLLLTVLEAYPGGIDAFDAEIARICSGPAWKRADDAHRRASGGSTTSSPAESSHRGPRSRLVPAGIMRAAPVAPTPS